MRRPDGKRHKAQNERPAHDVAADIAAASFVSQEMHYSRAAQRLNISQSGLSHAIAALEQELGVSLFQKSGRGIALGRYGAALLPQAQQIVALVPTLFAFSEKGPGSMHAPIIIALIAGLVVGALCQKSRMCMVAGIRDLVLFKDWKLLLGFVTIILTALIGNLLTGNFHLGFSGQPVAHSVHLWNFMGMLIVGLGSVLLGGCPLRQLILTGEGNTDSAVTVLGYIVGAAFAHNFGLAGAAASAEAAGGPSINGKIAVIIGLVVMLVIAAMNTAKAKKNA